MLLGGACAALLLGCGSGSSGFSGYSDDLTATWCDYLFRCAGGEGEALLRVEDGTEGACLAANEGFFDLSWVLRPYLDAGTVVFDDNAARRCRAAWGSTCSYTLALERACGGVFVGQVADGEGCTHSRECASGACTGSSSMCGSCLPVIPTGSPCTYQDPCAGGPNGEYGSCEGVCVLDDETWPTVDATEGQPCDNLQACEPGLFCQDGVCAGWRTVGEACDPSSDSCEPGSFCQWSDPGVGTCVAVRMETRAGEDCGFFATEMVVCDARAGLACTIEGERRVCAPYEPTQAEYEDCDRTAECIEGLECRGGACYGPLLAAGGACRTDEQCESDHCQQAPDPQMEGTCLERLICP